MENLDETQIDREYYEEVKQVSQERLETARRCLGEWATPQHLRELDDEQRRVQLEFIQHYGAGSERPTPVQEERLF